MPAPSGRGADDQAGRHAPPAAALPPLPQARELAGAVLGPARSRVVAVCGFVALQGGDPGGFGAPAAAGRAVLAAAGAGFTAGVLGLNVSYADLLIRFGRLDEARHLTAKVLDLADVMPGPGSSSGTGPGPA